MLHRASCRQSCIRSIMPHSYSLPSPSTISWKASVVSFAHRRGFFGLFFDGILKSRRRKSPSWKSSEWGWAEQRTPVMRGIEPIGNWGLGVGFSWNRCPNTFLRNHAISYLKISMLYLPDDTSCAFLWLEPGVYILIDWYNYFTVFLVSSRNLPFSDHDLAQLVLLLPQATKSLYSVLPGNELVLFPLPSRNQSPSGP